MNADNTIYLLNCYMLDVNHEHTVDFTNRQKQREWFLSKTMHVIENCKYIKRDNALVIDMYINDKYMIYSNYVMAVNDEGREEYYFIINKEYLSDFSTKIYLKLDVFQTYLFDLDMSKYLSLVDRCHMDRWSKATGLPYIMYMREDEGLECGEYILNKRNTLYNYFDKGSYILSSSTCLGAQNGGGSSGSSGSSNGKLYLNGLVSEEGFVFIKSMEGFSSTPYNLGDGTYTIGYGTTSVYDKDHYNQLAPQCTEQQASEVFADSLDNNYAKAVLKYFQNSGFDMSKMKQQHFDAFVSFYYNTGNTSKKIFTDYINGVDEDTIYNEWLTTTIMVGSAFEQGLRNRRKAEANVFKNGTYSFKEIYDLNTGTKITDNDGKGYVPERYIYSETVISELRGNITATAKSLIGKPYIWGGNYPPLGSDSGTDCSGLCQWSYHQNGISISRTTYTQVKEGKEVSYDELQPGDLVFMSWSSSNTPEHVVMFLSKNDDGSLHCVEAKGKAYGILETDRSDINNYRYRNLIGD